MKERTKTKRRIRFPILAKTLIMIFGFALVVVEAAMTFYSLLSSKNNQESYLNTATNLSGTVALVVDVPKFEALTQKVTTVIEDYITETGHTPPTSEEWGSEEWISYSERFRTTVLDTPEFVEMHTFLANIAAANSEDVDCVYLVYTDVERELFIYICDSTDYDPTGAFEDMDMCPPGCIDPIFDFNRGVLEHPSIGFPAYTTNTEAYGWLATSGTAIFKGDEKTDENVVGFALVDISLTDMRARQRDSIVQLFFMLFGTVNLIALIGAIIVYFVFTRPVKRLTKVAAEYDPENPEKTHEEFSKLKVGTHDEVSELADSLKKMENDSFEKMSLLTETNRELRESKKETKEMRTLAKKDGLTNVQNKLAYVEAEAELNRQIKEGKNPEFGIAMIDLNYLKETNDESGHDAGDISLVKLARLVRKTFKFSHIYRVGGDEFTVIILKSDVINVETLVEEFKEEIDKLAHDESVPVYERISAAIGYSMFNKRTDECVDDVFKRADTLMYENKREMKMNK